MTDSDTGRVFTRVPVHLKAEVISEDGQVVRGSIRDVSMSGLSIETGAMLPPDMPCAIRLQLETGTRPIEVEARGTVLRSEPGLLALRLSTVDADGFEHLQKLVLYNAKSAQVVEDELAAHADEQPALAPLKHLH